VAEVARGLGPRDRSPGGRDAGGGFGIDWAKLYGLIITATGWRVCDVDEITLHDWARLNGYWLENPPVHLMLKSFLGVKKRSKGDAPANRTLSEADITALGGTVNLKDNNG